MSTERFEEIKRVKKLLAKLESEAKEAVQGDKEA